MQLLKITSVPLEYEIHTEAARLEMKQAQNPSHVMTKNPSGWTMHARNIQVRMDTTELRASLNMRNSMGLCPLLWKPGPSGCLSGCW